MIPARYNMDFSKRVVITPENYVWFDSPSATVMRMPLEREAVESGHTTSIVRYAAEASFAEHAHPGGEEIFVLDGVFEDDAGRYPAGTYLRNPIGTTHAPRSGPGCTLFVKLAQHAPDDRAQLVIDTQSAIFVAGYGRLRVLPLHTHGCVSSALVYWPAGEHFVPHTHVGGEEIVVISGEFRDEHGRYPAGSWLRSPHLSSHHPWVEVDTLIYVKTGHLA
jgi:anti-sigma factor ChrR (cupin superfamily)